MYGRNASELVKEFASSEPGQLAAFNEDLFSQVIEECNSHLLHLQSLLRKMQEEPENQAYNNGNHFGALIHRMSLVATNVVLWPRHITEQSYSKFELDCRVLPEEIEEKLSLSEKEYFKNHSSTLQSYTAELDLDLAVDMVPPKDTYIKVRVLDEIGNVL